MTDESRVRQSVCPAARPLKLRGGGYSTEAMYLSGHLSRAVYDLPADASLNDCERAENCRGPFKTEWQRTNPNLDAWREDIAQRLYFCDLGTLDCSECHGDASGEAEDVRRIVRKYHRWPKALRVWWGRHRLTAREI